jgi:hypothetical protein
MKPEEKRKLLELLTFIVDDLEMSHQAGLTSVTGMQARNERIQNMRTKLGELGPYFKGVLS